MNVIDWAERGWLPDPLIALGIRRLLAGRLREQAALACDGVDAAISRFAADLRGGPIAIETQAANQQHYEVPSEFFQTVLGPRLKYSCCLWPSPSISLNEAEEEMLSLTCQRAGIADGMELLDLGCGWGSLSFWIAEHYPGCRVLAVSNSAVQRKFIERRAAELGRTNITVVTADIREFATEQRFDRIVSIEMFEHLRNYEELLRRIAGWLRPDGRLFVHVFCHRQYAYAFETNGASNWMGRHFFTGGLMPSADLLTRFQRDLTIERTWTINGEHYARTARAWLNNLDQRRAEVEAVLSQGCSPAEARLRTQRWRMFFLACEELFGYRGGTEWQVGHYLFRPAG